MQEKKLKRRRRFGRLWPRKWPSGRRTWNAIWFSKAQRRRLTRAFKTEKEAKDFLDELEKRELMGFFAPPPTHAQAVRAEAAAQAVAEPPPVPAFLEYAEHVIEKRFESVLAKGTLGMYRAALRAWKDHFAKKAPRLDQLTVADWLDYRSWRAGVRNSTHGTAAAVGPRTLNADLQCMVRILNEAVLDGHLAANPLAGTKKLREPKRPRRFLSLPEIAALLTHCPPRFRPLLTTALFTGCRKSELVAVRWHDVDFDGGKIAVFRSKTGSCDRLDMHPAVAKELRRLKKTRKGAKADDFVFLSTHKTPIVDVRKSWNAALEAAGIEPRPGLTFHCTRHSFASWFLSNGGAVSDLMAQLGHSKMETTQIYAAALSERRRESVMELTFGAAAGARPKLRAVKGRRMRAS